MGKAACHRNAFRKIVVRLVTITGKVAMIAVPQKFHRMIPAPGPFILEQDHSGMTAVFIRHIYPHPVLGGCLLFRLIQHLDPGLIAVGIPAPEEFLLHQIIYRLKVPLATQDHPVRHCLCAEVQVIPCEFTLLTGQGHAVHILCIHDPCNQGWGCDAPLQKRHVLFRPYHLTAVRAAVDIGDLFHHLKVCRNKF